MQKLLRLALYFWRDLDADGHDRFWLPDGPDISGSPLSRLQALRSVWSR